MEDDGTSTLKTLKVTLLQTKGVACIVAISLPYPLHAQFLNGFTYMWAVLPLQALKRSSSEILQATQIIVLQRIVSMLHTACIWDTGILLLLLLSRILQSNHFHPLQLSAYWGTTYVDNLFKTQARTQRSSCGLQSHNQYTRTHNDSETAMPGLGS